MDELHRAARRGDVSRLRELLAPAAGGGVDTFDSAGRTPLMYAVGFAGVEAVKLLLAAGASVHQESQKSNEAGEPVLSFAVSGGDPEVVRVLIEAGADVKYERNGYDALIDSVHGRDVYRDPRLLDLLQLLVTHGASIDGVTSYNESVLRVLSRKGRFDAIQLLLEVGANESLLSWTPLIKAVALGTLADVARSIDQGAALEGRDYWERTAWLVAVLIGDIAKAQLLLDKGADRNAVGRCSRPTLFYAIQTRQIAMLRWLLSLGLDVEQTDEFGMTPLMEAAEHNEVEALKLLIAHGAEVERKRSHDQTALSYCRRAGTARVLLAAGDDPAKLTSDAKRDLLNLSMRPNDEYPCITAEDFKAGQNRRFGTGNPEEIHEPFWLAMIRCGFGAYKGPKLCTESNVPIQNPVWCAERFGQSLTFLPDGRAIQIGGEHEDFYDEDFCIYNDVFVHHPDGTIRIFAYPESVFPCTDFHTATLLEDAIWIIGALGYGSTRKYGATPVYALNIHTYRMREITTSGAAPGWIHKHRATLSGHEIRITSGIIASKREQGETHEANEKVFVLDVQSLKWRQES
jgi:ankyrin repeat protein